MPKVLETISNIFSRNRSQLESDAVPLPDNDTDQINSGDRSSSQTLVSPGSQDNLAIVEQNGNLPSSSVDLYDSSTNSTTNNILAVNNTQGQVVYQFSHINGLHMGSVYHINSGKEGSSNEKPKRRRTETVVAMMRSEEQLTHKMLDCISTHLGEGWQLVMRDLNFSEGQIHQAKVDYQNDGGLKEVIYQLLLDWSRNEYSATLGTITQLLWKAGHFETVNYMKKTWKAEKTDKSSQSTV